MTEYRYGPGEWTALAHAGRAALLDPAVSTDDVAAIWEALSNGEPLESWLEVLAGRGLSSLPGFGLVEPSEGGLRVVVRGDVWAQVSGYELNAGGMRTWREHVTTDGSGVVLQVAEATGDFPLLGGQVLAASITIGEVGSSATAQESEESAQSGAFAAVPGDGGEPLESAEGGESSQPEPEPEQPVQEPVEQFVEDPIPVEPVRPVPEDEGESTGEDVWFEGAEAAQVSPLPDAAHASGHPDVAAEQQEWDEQADDQQEWDQQADEQQQWDQQADEQQQWDQQADEQQQWDQQADEQQQWAPAVSAPAASEWGEHAGGVAGAGDHDGYTVVGTDFGDQEQQPEHEPSSAVLLDLSDGQQVDLSRPALLGRAPEASRFTFDETPQLVTVPSPQQDISRTHAEIRVEGDHVLVTDLQSTNGTVVVLPGAPPRRLHPGESVPVPAGTLVDLGDGLTGVVSVTGAADPQA